MTHPTSHAAPAGIDLDKLEALARNRFNGGLSLTAPEALALISLARSAAHAAPAAQAVITDAMVDACYNHPEKVPAAGKSLMRKTLERALAASPAPVAAHADDITYTVDGVVMSPLEYIDHLHQRLDSAAPGKADAADAGGLTEVELLTLELQNQRELTQHWKMKALAAPAPSRDAASDAPAAKEVGGWEKLTQWGAPGIAIGWQLDDEMYVKVSDLRAMSASIGEDGLPELPHDGGVFYRSETIQYAREAVAADRRARESQGEPVAWAAFADNGNIRVWTSAPENVRKLAESVGMELTPLYAAPPLSSEPQTMKGTTE